MGYRLGRLDPCFHRQIANDTVHVPFSCPKIPWTKAETKSDSFQLVIAFPVKFRCLAARSPVSIRLGLVFRRSRKLPTLFLFVVIPTLQAKPFIVPVVGSPDRGTPFGPGRACVWHHDKKVLMEALQSPNRTCKSSCV